MKKGILLFVFLFIAAPLHAETSTADMVRKMEIRRGFWTSLHGFLHMNFSTPQGKSAQCMAELYYNRLEEEIILKGFRGDKELLFIFETNDRDFRLYLPKQKTLFHGTIFDMEDSPDIHSHLKALDLYRALKPGLLRAENTAATESDHGLTLLETPQRKVWVNITGDVLKESYSEKNTIERSNFKKISPEGKSVFYYPYTIAIKNNDAVGEQKTELVFESAEFDTDYKTKFPEFSVPKGIKNYDVSRSFKEQEALAG